MEPGAAYEVRVRVRNFTGLDSPYGYFTSGGVIGDRIAPGEPMKYNSGPNCWGIYRYVGKSVGLRPRCD